MNQLFFIVGPTASGKTSLALKLAKHLNGQIISADSRQAYKQMDIGTGKDLEPGSFFKKTDFLNLFNNTYDIGYYIIQDIKVWLYDIADPSQPISTAVYYQTAQKVIHKLWDENILPIIVGGTGLYIKTLLTPPSTLHIPPNLIIREQLRSIPVDALQHQLQTINSSKWQQMNQSDRHNPRRLIRAIEVATFLNHHSVNNHPVINLSTLSVGVKSSLSTIDQCIQKRVQKRLNQGMIDEVKNLDISSLPSSNQAVTAMGYSQISQFLNGKISLNQAKTQWATAEKQYARRQLTWFKKMPKVNWFDPTTKEWYQKVVSLVDTWYSQNNDQD